MATNARREEPWQQEILARHRWGQHGSERADTELSNLRSLWDAIQPVNENTREIIDPIQ